MIAVAELDAMPRERAVALFLGCAGSQRYAVAMADARPFGQRGRLLEASAEALADLERADWLQAFASHPEIGDRAALAHQPTGSTAAAEQAGVADASRDLLAQLASGNRRYRERFGWIFIVCAQGKSAAEMLAILEGRLANAPAAEFTVAAAEHASIVHIRLSRLVAEEQSS